MRVNTATPNAAALVAQALAAKLDPCRPIVVVCVGTDRSTGDALGPLVGTMLVRANLGIPVYGTLDHPVHATNLTDTLQCLAKHKNAQVIAVDACLGAPESVGIVAVKSGPLQPGAGVHKPLPLVGDLHVVGVVNVGGFMEYFILQNTRLNLVMRMANVIADGISQALVSRTALEQVAVG